MGASSYRRHEQMATSAFPLTALKAEDAKSTVRPASQAPTDMFTQHNAKQIENFGKSFQETFSKRKRLISVLDKNVALSGAAAGTELPTLDLN